MRMLVVSPNAKRLEALKTAASQQAPVSSLSALEGSLAQRGPTAIGDNTDVLLIDATQNPMPELDALAGIQPSHPNLTAILVTTEATSEVLLRALRLGVKEVLTPDTIESELASALQRINDSTSTNRGELAKTFAFVSAKGGSGSTFLAANFAHALATSTKAQVLLMDLDLSGGNAHLMLSARKPLVSVADMAREIHRVDASFLKSSMIDILPNLGVLAAPEDGNQVADVRGAHVETLIALARKEFDYVVIDAGRSIVPTTIRALDASDYVFAVCQLSVPFIREARRLVLAIRGLDYAPEKVKLIVNRDQKVRGLTHEDLEKAVGMEVYATIPNHYPSVHESIDQGTAIATHAKSSPVNKAIMKLVSQFTSNGAHSSWFGRMLKRQ